MEASTRIDAINRKAVIILSVLLLLIVVAMEFLLRRDYQGGVEGLGARYADASARIAQSTQSIEQKIARDDLELNIVPRTLEAFVADAAEPEEDPDGLLTDHPPAELRLTGISYTPEKPIAFVNGRMVTNGQEIEGCKILDIRPDRVRYRTPAGEELDLRIRK